MTQEIYFIALPFIRCKEGALVGGEARKCSSAKQAAEEASKLATESAGAVAFSRAIDPARGTFDPGHVIRSIGDVPKLDYLLGVS